MVQTGGRMRGSVSGLVASVVIVWLSFVAKSDGLQHPAYVGDKYVVPSSPLVRERIEWLRDQKLCLMIHFGLYSVLGITESWPLSTKDAAWARSEIEWTTDDTEFKKQYFSLNRCFNPIRFDPKGLARLAKRCGFRYVAFTTKHHDGFCLYDSKYTDYKTTSPDCPFSVNRHADIVKVFFDACRNEGLGISAYFSKADWHHEDFWENRGIGRETSRYATYAPKDNPDKWARFRAFTKNQILELVEKYGPIDAMWLDGGWICPGEGHDIDVKDIIDSARKIKPDLISVDRGARDEYMNIRTPEQSVPDKPLGYPWESCITMSRGWGYHPDDAYKSPRELVHLLIDVVAKDGNLALNVGPMPDGRLPRPAIERIEAIGCWLGVNGAAIYETRAVEPFLCGNWRFTRGKDGRLFAIYLWKEGTFDVMCMPLNVFKWHGRIKRITHLATGRGVAFCENEDEAKKGVLISWPKDLRRNDFADAFVIESETVKQKGE